MDCWVVWAKGLDDNRGGGKMAATDAADNLG